MMMFSVNVNPTPCLHVMPFCCQAFPVFCSSFTLHDKQKRGSLGTNYMQGTSPADMVGPNLLIFSFSAGGYYHYVFIHSCRYFKPKNSKGSALVLCHCRLFWMLCCRQTLLLVLRSSLCLSGSFICR